MSITEFKKNWVIRTFSHKKQTKLKCTKVYQNYITHYNTLLNMIPRIQAIGRG